MKFGIVVTLFLSLFGEGAPPAANSPPPALSIRLLHPDSQGASVIRLFEGSRAANPAAALAAWRHATATLGLGKAREALISVFNPAMVRELKIFDRARFNFRVDPESGAMRWQAVMPEDDGTLAAIATSVALTNGATDSVIDGRSVLRLGPPGAPFALARPGRMVLASDREGLLSSFAADEVRSGTNNKDEGCIVRLDPAGLRGLKSLNARRAIAALDALGCNEAIGHLGLVDQTLTFDLTTKLTAPATSTPAIDPEWLKPIPGTEVIAAAVVAFDNRVGTIESTFALLDRIEKADSARVNVAPLRIRLNLLAAGVKIFPEQDLWPVLQGVTVVVLGDSAGQVSGGLLVYHARDEIGATKLFDRVLPRLAAAYSKKPVDEPAPDGIRAMGVVSGKPITATRRGKSILLGWGQGALTTGLDATDHPERSSAALIRASWGPNPPQRCGVLWPGRLGDLVSPDTPLAKSLAEAPPVFWNGRIEGDTLRDQIRWNTLSGVIKRWLDALPLETPSDR